tara:strand:- start:24 stop:440 length:417 start_codon:yes stop_codon:yes gene_type:complete
MKKQFTISNEEKNRILGLHESMKPKHSTSMLNEQSDMAKEAEEMEEAYQSLSSEVKKMVDFLSGDDMGGDNNWIDAEPGYDLGSHYTVYTTYGADGDSVEFNWKTNKIIITIGGVSQTIPYTSSFGNFKQKVEQLIET